MGFFTFLIFLGITNIIFNLLWQWVIALPFAFLFAVTRFEKGPLFLKTIGAYFLVSLTALITLGAVGDDASTWKIILFPLLGAFALFMGFASASYEQKKEAQQNGDYMAMLQIEKYEWFNAVLSIGSVVLYILILFIPAIATNSLNGWLLTVIGWISEIPVIGWLIGIGGVFFMGNTILHGIIMTVALGWSGYAKLRGKSAEDSE